MRRLVAAALAVWTLGCVAAEGPRLPRPGEPAPEYSATTLDGEVVSLESLRGEVVLLNFWATWCAPCRYETPFLQELYEDHVERGFRIVGVSMDTPDAADAIAMFLEEYEVTYTVLHDPQQRGMETYQIIGLPATFLLDREGALTWMKYGPVGETDQVFLDALEDALSAGESSP